MRVITYLSEQEFHQLQKLANDERRPIRDQAGYLLSQALKALTAEQREGGRDEQQRISA